MPAVEPDLLDTEEFRYYEQSGVSAEKMQAILNVVPSDQACALVRELLPILAQKAARKIQEPAPQRAN